MSRTPVLPPRSNVRPSIPAKPGPAGAGGAGHDPIVSPPPGLVTPPPLPPTGAPGTPGRDQMELRKRAVDLFTFLRELVSLRTTVVRNCDSYDRVLWLNDVPRDPECDCVAFGGPREDEDDWWLQVRKPAFTEPPQPPSELLPWADPAKLADSSFDAPRPHNEIDVPRELLPAAVRQTGGDEPAGRTAVVKLADHPEVCAAWDRYIDERWKPWAAEDRRMRGVLKIYTDLFSLYQQQKELGEAYEVVIALGQLRWAPKPGVTVNRHVVAVQTSIEFDAQRGVITVGPAAEGAKPRLEEDMLELDERPAPDVLTALEQQVAQCDDDIWHNEQMVGALKSFVHSLGAGDGSYTDDLVPVDAATAVPRVHWAPAVIVRHRTEQGLLQVYGKILEDLKRTASVPQGLLPLVEIASQGRVSRDEVIANAAAVGAPADEGLLFPLHFNDEQRQIVHRLSHQSGVVVQGPPGTGKSHTIANLVCHLLATGNRVLVTSHAPRALRILKDKIPQAITNMCVVLLGNDRTAFSELEQSVQVITKQLNAWDPTARTAIIKEIEAQLATLRERAAEVDRGLRAVRESDTVRHPELPGGYGGTLQDVAQALRTREANHAWIAPFTQGMEQLPDSPGVTDEEGRELAQALRGVTPERRKELERELPALEQALPPDQFERMIAEEKQWHDASAEARPATEQGEVPLVPPDLDADDATVKELADLLERVLRHTKELESHHFPWVPRMARDIRGGQYETWSTLLGQTQPRVAAIRQQPEAVYELETIGLGNVEIPTFRDDVEVLYKHQEAGGKFKKMFRYVSPARERRYVFKDVQIGGKRVRRGETLRQVYAWAEVQSQLKALEQLWADVSEGPQGAVNRRIANWNERCAMIDGAKQMHENIQRLRERFGRLNGVGAVPWHDTEKLKLLHNQLKAIIVRKEYATRRQAMETLAEQAERRAAAKGVHPIFGEIAEAFRGRDLEGYRAAHTSLKRLWAERATWTRCAELLLKVSARLPRLAKTLSDDASDPVWEERVGHINDAWLWLKADRWLKQQLDPKHFEYLQQERKSLQEHVQAAMVKLAAEKAWFHCMSRMTPAEETYLKAWMQAVRNIGAGTGKRAARFRKVARQTLDRCRSAIPAWIMPIHRLAETVTPGEDQFDVVIVDEASQSGAEALFLHYIAKKIIIVGDDKQIAPYNVGINRDDVELLRSRHIRDLPLSDYFDLEHSFFDQAYLRFGNRIRLCEHFRCMPEIIQFSNALCYANEPLLPLRQYGDARIEPVVVARHVPGAKMDGTSPTVSNRPEAEAIVKQIAKCVADPAYKDKTFGVISLLGEKQARLIEQKLLHTIGPEEMERRRLICGDAYSFQGDERNVMFISLVVAADEGRRLATLTQAADERRFNVAASRARDQMWLFHSVVPDDLSMKCLRRQLLEYCLKPQVPEDGAGTQELDLQELEAAASTADRSRAPAPPPFESWLEVDVYLQLRRRGYRVLPKHSFVGYKIDLVVSGTQGRLAVQCDAQEWHGQDRYDTDMNRQRQLERCGWRFWRIRGGTFYRNPDAALQALWDLLDKQGIRPRTDGSTAEAPKPPAAAESKPAAREGDGEPEPTPARKPRRRTKSAHA